MNIALNTPVGLPTMRGNFAALEQEHDYWVEEVEGSIPADLTGSFFRNGPGRLKIGHEAFGHWFDGDGMVCRTTFRDGKAHFCNRFVRTKKYVDETREQRIIYRGMGNMPEGGLLKRMFSPAGNPANTSLYLQNGTLLALSEASGPVAMDPKSLDTFGDYNFDGGLKKFDKFSAHGKYNPRDRCYYNFGITVIGFGATGPKFGFSLYKISPEMKVVDRVNLPLDQLCFLHDFALTERYAVFFQSSIVFGSLLTATLGLNSMAESIRFDPSMPSKILVVDLKHMRLVQTLDIPPMAIVHFSNAYQQGRDLIVDGMKTTTFEVNKHMRNVFTPDVDFSSGVGDYTRFVINIEKGTVREEPVSDQILPGEFPQWDRASTTYKNRYTVSCTYVDNGTKKYFNGVQKIDLETGEVQVHDFGPYRFTGEPLMVRKQSAKKEDEGVFYLISYVYNGNEDRSEVVVIDAEEMQQELAVIKLKHHVPQGFHGIFTPQVYV